MVLNGMRKRQVALRVGFVAPIPAALCLFEACARDAKLTRQSLSLSNIAPYPFISKNLYRKMSRRRPRPRPRTQPPRVDSHNPVLYHVSLLTLLAQSYPRLSGTRSQPTRLFAVWAHR
ncbi:hypothetical protein M434DRAFT_369514 [Hypoxylon sp. CO27-5]|nr:hypothetical protein M434DRAFT_369514 [Hypoxylon sp. CO27-5]